MRKNRLQIADAKIEFMLISEFDQKQITGGDLPSNTWLNEVVINGGSAHGNGTLGNIAGFFGGIAEAALGFAALPESGATSSILIFDGLMRAGLISGDAISGQNLPTSFGGVLGSYWGSQGAAFGTLLDDSVAALAGGGIWGDLEVFTQALNNGDTATAGCALYDISYSIYGTVSDSYDLSGSGSGGGGNTSDVNTNTNLRNIVMPQIEEDQ